MVWIFSYQQTGTNCNGINYRHLPSDRNRIDILLSLPNRIFFNFSHKPLFHNAISYSVRHSIIRSFPMVWIFFLSINRNYLPPESTIGIPLGISPHRYSFFLFQIDSSGNFLTSHYSTMLYHIVSDTEKLGPFRWSGLSFLSITPGILEPGSTIGIHSRTGTA